MSHVHLDIDFDELPEDRRIGYILLHKSFPRSASSVFAEDTEADLLWSRWMPELNATVCVLHHPIFLPLHENQALPEYTCQFIYRFGEPLLAHYKTEYNQWKNQGTN